MCHIFLNLLQESLPRLSSENFYYSQEDTVFEIAAKRGFTWSVARPGLIVGFATKTEVFYSLISGIINSCTKLKHKPA